MQMPFETGRSVHSPQRTLSDNVLFEVWNTCDMFHHVSDPNAPFRRVLWMATDRLFVRSMDLSTQLDTDPQGILYQLSSAPHQFGELRALNASMLRKAHENLITAARAYIVHARKMNVPDEQPELPLPGSESD